MQLVIISGRAGAGKTTALHQLEDDGYYCIDNLPASLLAGLCQELSLSQAPEHQKVAVCIDARNTQQELDHFPSLCEQARQYASLNTLFIDAEQDVLIKRFGETRRKHPLSNASTALGEALDRERQLLAPIAAEADITIDSTDLNLYQLRDRVKSLISGQENQAFNLQIMSFGFKAGLPNEADMVFDLRSLPNPHWQEELRPFTGQNPSVQAFLEGESEFRAMHQDIFQFLATWLPKMRAQSRSYVTVALGCTGGKHRSVYMAEKLAGGLSSQFTRLQLRHRDMPISEQQP